VILFGVSWRHGYGHRLIIFGFVPQSSKMKAVAVDASMGQAGGLCGEGRSAGLDDLAGFRCAFYECSQMIPGWPYSFVAAWETGRSSWTAVRDAIRLEPGPDMAAVTTNQIRDVVQRLIEAAQWARG
jgi:hypothetical protein